MSRNHPNFFPNRIQTSFYGTGVNLAEAIRVEKERVEREEKEGKNDSLPRDIEETGQSENSETSQPTLPIKKKKFTNNVTITRSRKPQNFN